MQIQSIDFAVSLVIRVSGIFIQVILNGIRNSSYFLFLLSVEPQAKTNNL